MPISVFLPQTPFSSFVTYAESRALSSLFPSRSKQDYPLNHREDVPLRLRRVDAFLIVRNSKIAYEQQLDGVYRRSDRRVKKRADRKIFACNTALASNYFDMLGIACRYVWYHSSVMWCDYDTSSNVVGVRIVDWYIRSNEVRRASINGAINLFGAVWYRVTRMLV